MYYRLGTIVIVCMLAFAQAVHAQDDQEERDALKIAAIEALMSAPPERALPAVTKVLQGNNSDEVKEAALFILSQIETPEAQALLLEMARSSEGELREEAISMIGIGGDPVNGTNFIDCLAEFQADPETHAIMMLGDDRCIEQTYVLGDCIYQRDAQPQFASSNSTPLREVS